MLHAAGDQGCSGTYTVIPTLKTKSRPADFVTLTRLSDTSALVTLLAGEDVHVSPYSSKYRDLLDLSAGGDFLRRCAEVWPHLDQLVKNRKTCIQDEVFECIRGGAAQVVILGSGLDPLSLEIAYRVGGVRVYEVDADQMDDKRDLIREAAPDAAERIACVTADLARPRQVIQEVASAGWDASLPSVLVLEGISYYLSEQNLWEAIAQFGGASTNDTVLEYVVPHEMIIPERAHIPDAIFEIIRKSVMGPLEIARFGPDTIRDKAGRIGGRLVNRHTMRSIELSRTGVNRYFPTDRSGWVEVVRIRTSPIRTDPPPSPGS